MAEVQLGEGDPSHELYAELLPVYQCVNNFLRDTSCTADDTAATLTDASQWSQKTLEVYCWDLGWIWVSKILEIPALHPLLKRLIQLLYAIQKRPAPRGEDSDFWFCLPRFFGQLNELNSWRGLYDCVVDDPKDLYTAGEWASVNSFQSLWYNDQPLPVACEDVEGYSFFSPHPQHGLGMLRTALEITPKHVSLNQVVPAAAVWIVNAGRKFHERCRLNKDLGADRISRRPYQVPDEFYKGEDTYNLDRWKFWKSRFGELQNDETLEESTRQWAARAYTAM
ncbi:hypothetical protein PFICI_10862 [Pestalotiopsis fici W106-1]|uniref:Uncharacterized protein n=1 Tax=Pestalotiopsis fici (strain W106-1 / CGMCC3.15140) TaxID=1229662 RepID=W3WSY5_PESFW|nr:uncharacterized protein PFICI_10862 [Pestalotiopsis fici W106-1]ETS76988.1 hypothetical protein PFICI_10862 [Pestalotiopsis fici W106-1]